MDQRTSPEVLEFASKREPGTVDRVGQDLLALLQGAAQASNEKVERAIDMAHKLSMQLRDAEDRIAQLEGQNDLLHGEVEHLQARAARAESWLERIKKEIEGTLVAAEANRPELPFQSKGPSA